MFDSYESPYGTNPPKFDWEERFYEALLGGRDPAKIISLRNGLSILASARLFRCQTKNGAR
jgi:hypothetical protein